MDVLPADPTVPGYYMRADYYELLADLRRNAPVHEFAPGMLTIARYDDIREISRDPARFRSSMGALVNDPMRSTEPPIKAPSILHMDPPDHVGFRKLVNREFTPREIGSLEPRIRELARAALDRTPDIGVFDFVDLVAAPFPLMVIVELLGIPDGDRPDFRRWSDATIEATDKPPAETAEATGELFRYLIDHIAAKQANPGDDVVSLLVGSEVDGRSLDRDELLIFLLALLVAGNETTRTLISGGTLTLAEHPDQRADLVADPSLIPSAVEECLRWVTPIQAFARTVTADTEIGGVNVKKLDYLVMLYASGNRDEGAFGPTADVFDIRRDTNPPHLAFGFGEHLCLGAALARMEARILFEEMLTRHPNYVVAGEPEWVQSSLVRGMHSMPLAWNVELDQGAPATFADLVFSRADDDTVGLLYEDHQWSWREVVAEARVRAELFVQLREPGPFHVGVLLENVPDFVFVLMGAGLVGAAVVGINPTRRGAELARDINHTDCQLIITDGSMRPLLDGIPLDLPADRILDIDTAAYAEALAGAAEGVARGELDSVPGPHPETLFALLFTSGSTGAPKAVRMTQGRAARAVPTAMFESDDVLYCAMPLYHGNALNANLFYALRSGATIALRRKFSASGFLPDVRRYGVTYFNTVGRALNHILATPESDDDRNHAIKFVLGPETAPADVRAFRKRFGPPVIEGYGSSENAIIMVPDPTLPKGSLGRPLEGIDVVILDSETGAEKPRARYDEHDKLLNVGEAIGEMVSRTATSRFEGYYNNPEADAERTRNGWYWSGDLGYRDEADVFWFVGRNADWIRVDGENFAAAPVERIIARFPGADGVAVYAVPDSRTGDQVMAAIEMLPGASFDPDMFATFLSEQRDLGTKWAPRYVRVVDALPVGATDKIDKRPLRAERWETTDPVFWRAPRAETYVSFTSADADALRAEFEANDRGNLLQ